MALRTALVGVSIAVAGASTLGTDGAFDGRVASPAEISLLALGPPSNLSVEPSGNDVALSWNAGTNGSGYHVRAGTTCDAMDTVGNPATTSHTDTPAVAAGTPRCYGVVTADGSWTSATGNPATIVRVGFVAVSLAMAEGACGTGGELDCGDTFVVTFNQPADPVGVGAVAVQAGVIDIGVGTLSGGTADADATFAATSAWSNGNRTLTVTVGNRTQGAADPAIGGTWTLTPAGVTSATGNVAVCDTAGDCRPTS